MSYVTYSHRSQYGPAFKLLLGGRHITVVASEEAIHSLLAAEHGTLSSRSQSYAILRLLGSDSSHTQKLYAIATQELFPILDKRLAKRTLGDLTPGFTDVLSTDSSGSLITRGHSGGPLRNHCTSRPMPFC